MRDIPVFTTQYGVASLTLKEIPYRGDAYIRIQHTAQPELLLRECISFCRVAGAERIYAAGHPHLENYPVHTEVLKMHCKTEKILNTDAVLIPVQEQTLEQWRTLYNTKMQGIDNASYMSQMDAQRLLADREGYFVYRNGDLIGIGAASAETIRAVISLQKGAGADVVAALCRTLQADTVVLEVASTNTRAVSLYQRLGFQIVGEVARWYKII